MEKVKYLELSFIETLADELRINSGFEKKYISVEEIARNLGFEVFGTTFKDSNISGKVIHNDDVKEIYVADESYERQRFTIAHEIGHIILHHEAGESINEVDYRTSDKDFNRKEFQANAFASALLMPKKEAIKTWESLSDVDDFAEYFEVSKKAASIRLLNLGLI